MRIGIIGAGNIGAAIAELLANNSIEATIANSRGVESLQPLVQKLGGKITAGTIEQAAAADIIFLAVNWSKIPAATAGLDFNGKIVIDTNNPIESPAFVPFDLKGQTSSEVVAGFVKGAELVKAFNHLPPHLLTSKPDANEGKRVLFFAGDNSSAKSVVNKLIDRLGFTGIDLGSLAEGGRLTQFPGGALTAQHFIRL
ncbi:NADP oxidoreductase [Cellvibrio sp. KY-GH-1]|uniref:NADPH-dependent F420 reductase n=1 Tax=Cellvibrio sp. KY-GH-1 TaxID=2303332 RepID=UPI0012459A76|nr:NAD(P)-binding domain-containing protein [Cellvibrio sp. KY-GH-1]QEY15267.1 NADP oxidoreductase [Cellvibrio sp. KY-GH-1]